MKICSILIELPKNYHFIFCLQVNFLLQLLDSVDYFSRKSSDSQLFILSGIQNNNDSVTSNGLVFLNVFSNKNLFNDDVILKLV